MKLRCPLTKNFLNNGKVAVINQLFGENLNPQWEKSHTGIDFNTEGVFKYRRDATNWIKEARDFYELQGRIPIVATHAGKTTLILNPEKERQGWGVYVTADPVIEAGDKVQYRTLYWHIETPWGSTQSFMGAVKRFVSPTVVTGQIIAIAGNNGLSEGPHLHFQLEKRVTGGDWAPIDPMPFFQDNEVIYQSYKMTSSRWFYKGEEITRERVEEIKKTLMPVL